MNRLMNWALAWWCRLRGHHNMVRSLLCYDLSLDNNNETALTWHYNCLTCTHSFQTTRTYPTVQKAVTP
jgi:hypothetical protein